jgi:hypothetical protein
MTAASSAVKWKKILGLFLAFGLVGTVTNGTSLVHILKTFNVKKSVYLIILLDAVVSLGGFTALNLVSLAFAVIPGLAYGKVACANLFLSSFIPINFGPFFVSQISIFRFILVRKKVYSAVTLATLGTSRLSFYY